MKQNKPSNSRIADELSVGEDCPGLFQWSVLYPGPDRSQELDSPQKGCFFTVSVCGDRDSSSQSPSSALRESLLSSRRRLGGDLERGVCGERDRGKENISFSNLWIPLFWTRGPLFSLFDESALLQNCSGVWEPKGSLAPVGECLKT